MGAPEYWPGHESRPRVALVGAPHDALGVRGDALMDALAARCDIVPVDARASFMRTPYVLHGISRAVAQGAELLHVANARLAPAAAIASRRFRLPLSVTVSARDVQSRTLGARLARRAVRGFDCALTADECALGILRHDMPSLASSLVPAAATRLPGPNPRQTEAVSRALRGVAPSRLVLGLVWPENRNDLRWFRDAVASQLVAGPLCLVLGAPSRREARLLLHASGMKVEFRAVHGCLDGQLLAAVAPFVDAFALPAGLRRQSGHAVTALTLALAASGVPVVSDGRAEAAILSHERNGFLVARGDERHFASTLNTLLALPAQQRHAVGQDFARYTVTEWSADPAAEVYAAHFASLVGRPRIPAELRVA